MRALTQKTESQIYGQLPVPTRDEMMTKTQAIVEQKVQIVRTVKEEIERAYAAFPSERKEQFRSEYEAAMTDITNIEERVRFGFAYPERGEDLDFGVWDPCAY